MFRSLSHMAASRSVRMPIQKIPILSPLIVRFASYDNRKLPPGTKYPQPVNHNIRTKEVRVIFEDGTKTDLIPLHEAREISREHQLDLVLVSNPSDYAQGVVKLVDANKHFYNVKKTQKAKEKLVKKTKSSSISVSPKIEKGDFQRKVAQIEKLVYEGSLVAVSPHFKGPAREREAMEEKMRIVLKDLMGAFNSDMVVRNVSEKNFTFHVGASKKLAQKLKEDHKKVLKENIEAKEENKKKRRRNQ